MGLLLYYYTQLYVNLGFIPDGQVILRTAGDAD